MGNFAKPGKEHLAEIYRKAVTIKLNDERVIKEIMAGKLVTPYYSPRGQEIIPAAMALQLNDADYLSTIYRGTHDMIAKGFPLDLLWAELAGRTSGSCKGKGGTMHLTHPKTGCMVTTGIVGSSMPIANGLGWAAKLNGRNQVAVANFGDGACNIGAFHESLNFAALFSLPVIFVCQNNRYAEHTNLKRSSKIDQYAKRAAGYGMEGVTVDGNDADEMYGAAKWAVDRARSGEGPTMIEALTYRFNGHVLGDAGRYMDKAELELAKANDPMVKLRQRLIDEKILSADAVGKLEAEISAQIDAAVKAAYAAPLPDLGELKCDVFSHEIA